MTPAIVLLWWHITHNSFPSNKEPPKSITIINKDVRSTLWRVYLLRWLLPEVFASHFLCKLHHFCFFDCAKLCQRQSESIWSPGLDNFMVVDYMDRLQQKQNICKFSCMRAYLSSSGLTCGFCFFSHLAIMCFLEPFLLILFLLPRLRLMHLTNHCVRKGINLANLSRALLWDFFFWTKFHILQPRMQESQNVSVLGF